MALNIDPSKFQRLTSQDIANSESMQIDWGSVASNLSKTLTDVRDNREQRKQEIQDNTTKAMEKLSEVPDLKNQTLLTLYYKGGDDAKNAMRTYYDQVKRGLAKPNDYKIFQGNVLSGFKGLSQSFKNYDGYYNEMMQKIKSGEVSGLTQSVAESIEAFGNLKNKSTYTNPATGQIQVVSMLPDKDGNFTIMPDPKKNPELFQNPMSVNALMRFEEQSKNLMDEAKKLTDPLATVITASINNGSITSIEDFRQMDDIGGKSYSEWLGSQVETLTATDSDIAEILYNQGYKYASSKKEFAEKYPNLGMDKFIEMDLSSGSPELQLTSLQKQQARGFAASAIESQLDSIVKKTPPFRPDASDKVFANQKKDRIRIVELVNSALSPEFNIAKGAQDKIEADELYEGIESIVMKDIDGNQIDLTDKDFDINKVDVIEFNKLIKGKITPLNIQTKEKNPDGTFKIDPNTGLPIAVSGKEIVSSMLGNLNIPAAEIKSYIDDYVNSGKSFNTFDGIPSFNRTLGELGNVGGISVKVGKSSFPVDQGITDVLKNDFDSDDKLTQRIADRLAAEAGESVEAKEESERKLFTYKWGLISSMLDQAFTNKAALGGRRMFKVQPLEQGETIKINYDNKTIDLGLTLNQVNNNGSMLIEKITEAINAPKPTSDDGAP